MLITSFPGLGSRFPPSRSQLRFRDPNHSIQISSVPKESTKLNPDEGKADVAMPTDVPSDVATPVVPELPASRPRRVIRKPDKLDL